ncbi:MAG: putative membrane protein [halophilic archaeon J07HB67]|nr:MAG: putative membrane protein [halophilic archaeon J07HB67]
MITTLDGSVQAASFALQTTPAATRLAETGLAVSLTEFAWLEQLVETATGPVGLVIVFVYSFLIAFALPGVSEVVLLAPLELGLSDSLRLTVVIVVSALGKAAGSVLAFHLGQEAKEAGPIVRFLRNSRFDVIGWSERRSVEVARRYGYAGLAAALSIPFFPDTISIYAFAVLEEDYWKFALATFAGSVGRLLVTLGLAGVGLATFGG